MGESDLVSTESKGVLLSRLLAECTGEAEVVQAAEVAKNWELDSWLFLVAQRLLQIDPRSEAVIELLIRQNALKEEEAEQLLKLGETNGLAGALLTLGLAVESNYPAALQ